MSDTGFLAAAPTEAPPPSDAAMMAGFDDRPEPALPTKDALEQIADNGDMPEALRVLAKRLGRIEQHVPDTVKLAQSLVQAGSQISEMQKQVHYLSQQRAVAEMQMEVHLRSVALDLAIKTLPDAVKGSAEAAERITALAGGYLGWLRARQT